MIHLVYICEHANQTSELVRGGWPEDAQAWAREPAG
jgi:hypothetical protein